MDDVVGVRTRGRGTLFGARVVAIVSMAVVFMACGARTALFAGDLDAGPTADASGDDGPTDASTTEPVDAIADAVGEDAVVPSDAPLGLRIVFSGHGGAYDESSLQAFLAAYPATVTRDAANASPITIEALAAYDIVILDNVTRTFAPSEAQALATCVRSGGSVMSLSGFTALGPDGQEPNSLLADLALQYDSTLYVTDGDNGVCPGYITDFAAHPVTTGLHSVPYCGGYGVVLAGACDGPTQSVALSDDASVGSVCQEGAGRVYLWGDEWVEYSSTWVPGLDTQQFWQDAIDWLSHEE